MAARSKGSNTPRGMDVRLLLALCVTSYKSLRRTDHSSIGVLPTVVRGLATLNEEAIARVGPQPHKNILLEVSK